MQIETKFNLGGEKKKKGKQTIHNTIDDDSNDTSRTQSTALPHERLSNYEDMENAKYMMTDDKQVRVPKLAPNIRARDDDPGQSSQRSSMEVNIMKNLVQSYFFIVKKSMADFVPKTIINGIVNKSKNNCQRILVQKIYQDGANLGEILVEDGEVKQKRAKLTETINSLKESLDFLNEVRDFYFEDE